MPSVITTTRNLVADAVEVITDGNATVFRDWIPEIERKDIQGLQVHVAVESRATVLIARGCKRNTLTVWLMVIKPLKQNTTDEPTAEHDSAEALHEMADSLIDGLLGKQLNASQIITQTEQPVGTSPEHWREYRQCASFVKLTVEG